MDEMVRRAAMGDPAAFAALVRDAGPAVRTVLRQYVRSPEDIEDLAQEVFLRALQGLDTLDDPARFRSWLYAIARNAGLDHVRHTRRRPVTVLDDGVEPLDPDPGPDAYAEVGDLARRVRSGAARLHPRDATLLAMVTELGFTPTDVTGVLGMSPTAAKVAVHRARQRLRNAMLFEDTVAEAATALASRCDELDRLFDAGALVDAAVHVRSCGQCGSRVRTPTAC